MGRKLEPMPISTEPLVKGKVPSKEGYKQPIDPFPGWAVEEPLACCKKLGANDLPWLIGRVVEQATGRWFPIGQGLFPMGKVMEWDFSKKGLPNGNDGTDN